MTGDQYEGLSIERPELQRLFVNWLIQLLDERYGVRQRGSEGASRWNVTLTDESTIQVEFDRSGQPLVQGPAEHEDALASIVEDAHRRALALDFGKGAWWRVSFSTDMGLTGAAVLHFMRFMSEHNSRRFQGDWRLGSEALVSFQQANLESTPVVIPKFDVHITFRVPAPGLGLMRKRSQRNLAPFYVP